MFNSSVYASICRFNNFLGLHAREGCKALYAFVHGKAVLARRKKKHKENMVTRQHLPDSPSRFPEKLTGKMMPTESTPTTTSRPIMWRWKDK